MQSVKGIELLPNFFEEIGSQYGKRCFRNGRFVVNIMADLLPDNSELRRCVKMVYESNAMECILEIADDSSVVDIQHQKALERLISYSFMDRQTATAVVDGVITAIYPSLQVTFSEKAESFAANQNKPKVSDTGFDLLEALYIASDEAKKEKIEETEGYAEKQNLGRSYLNPVDMILDDDNFENIVLYDEENNEKEFEQIATIPLGDKTYVILKPVEELPGVSTNEALVFVIDEIDDEDIILLEDNKEIVDRIFGEYEALLLVASEKTTETGDNKKNCGADNELGTLAGSRFFESSGHSNEQDLTGTRREKTENPSKRAAEAVKQREEMCVKREKIKKFENMVFAGWDYTVGIDTSMKIWTTRISETAARKRASFLDAFKCHEGEIVSLGTSPFFVIALERDGTPLLWAGDFSIDHWKEIKIDHWKEIKAVSAGFRHAVGLKADGTVVAAGDNRKGCCNVGDWTDIVAVSAGDSYTVGLRVDGTVVAAGDSFNGRCNVSDWTDIVAVSAGDDHTVGLRADGTVVTTDECLASRGAVSDWTDIVAVSAGYSHIVALKADGTVVADGTCWASPCDVSCWKNVVAVSAGRDYTVGLTADGTVVATGENRCGECNIDKWKLFHNSQMVDNEREEYRRKKHQDLLQKERVLQNKSAALRGIFARRKKEKIDRDLQMLRREIDKAAMASKTVCGACGSILPSSAKRCPICGSSIS